MVRGVRWYLVGSVVLGALGVLAGCSGRFFAEREPWRREAEAACLSSGMVKEGPGKVRVNGISGPGACGADYPIKVSSLGDSSPLAFGGELRPPANVPNASMPQRWPGTDARPAPPATYERAPPYPSPSSAVEARPLDAPGGAQPYDSRRPGEPMSLDPRGPVGAVGNSYDSRRPYGVAPPPSAPATSPVGANAPTYDFSPEPYDRRRFIEEPRLRRQADPLAGTRPVQRQSVPSVPALGTRRAPVTSAGPVTVTPSATLACPLVSALDRWVATSVQPAALRWFGQPVVEMRQISAYACRGMNGNPNARISEHAFGNALDIASFTLADGRRITVREGWRGRPEEQGFLRDVQAAACDQFTTVLAPGSNAYHYDHIHVDLMRRSGGRRACDPDAVPGEEVAARARSRYAGKRDVTGSVARPSATRSTPSSQSGSRPLPLAVPGEDGED